MARRRGRPPKSTPRFYEPKRCITRRTVTEWVTTYRTRGGLGIKITTLTRPPKTKVMRTGHGRKKFQAVNITRTTKEIYIVARKKKDADVVTDEELEELEELDEELEEDEDEEVEDAEVVEDDDEDEEEEKPKKKAKKGKKAKKPVPPTRETPADRGNVGTAEVAEAAGIDSRTLRMVLRKHSIQKDEETGRYEWPSMNNKVVKKILKLIEAGEADDIKSESLKKLKEQKAAEKEAKAAKKAKKSKGKKKRVVEDDEDDDE